MNEVKEILRKTDIDALSFAVVVNYVTTLQQENERLRMRNDMLRKDIDSFIADNKIDYKSRCEKAIEYINNNFIDGEGMICLNTGEYTCEVNYNFLDDLLNILQGSDKE